MAAALDIACHWPRDVPRARPPGIFAYVASVGAVSGGGGGRLSMRFTHVYPDGPAPYFTFQARGRHGALAEQWRHIKSKSLDAVIEHGGTVTHHHAVGREHMPWYNRQMPETFMAALAGAKDRVDPTGILNPGVLLPAKGA